MHHGRHDTRVLPSNSNIDNRVLDAVEKAVRRQHTTQRTCLRPDHPELRSEQEGFRRIRVTFALASDAFKLLLSTAGTYSVVERLTVP